MHMNDILNARQTAAVMGCKYTKVTERLKRRIWTFGRAISPKETGMSQFQYEVKKADLADFLGIDVSEIDQRLGREGSHEKTQDA